MTVLSEIKVIVLFKYDDSGIFVKVGAWSKTFVHDCKIKRPPSCSDPI